MADPDPAQAAKDAAAKKRIISHLNADHQLSLSYYLQHYLHLSSSQARSPTMTDISFDSMSILTRDGKTHTVPISPPMRSWADARTKTVDMDRESRAGLGISHIRITSYEPPRKPVHILVFALCGMTYVYFLTLHRIVPGNWFYEYVLRPWFPGGPETFRWMVKRVCAPMLAIHFTELYLLDRTRLRRYGVQRRTRLWWMWACSVFVEGYGCFQRIDATVKRKEAEAERAKH